MSEESLCGNCDTVQDLEQLQTLAGNAPANRIAADVKMFPAGMFPINVWLSQTHFRLQCEQY